MDFRRTEAYRPRMRRGNEEVDVEEAAAAKPWRERRGYRGRVGVVGSAVVAGDALKRCLSGDVSYPRERTLVNRRGRFRGSSCHSAAPIRRMPTCQTVGIVFEYVAYLLSLLVVGCCHCAARGRGKEGERERALPLSLPLFLVPHRSRYPSLSNTPGSSSLYLSRLYCELLSLPVPPSITLVCSTSHSWLYLQPRLPLVVGLPHGSPARSIAGIQSASNRVMRRSIQINLDTGVRVFRGPLYTAPLAVERRTRDAKFSRLTSARC